MALILPRVTTRFQMLLIFGLFVARLNLVAQTVTSSRVDQILEEMTLEEKAGQLSQEAGRVKTGPNGNPLAGQEDRVAAGAVGSILNTTDLERMNMLQKIAVEKSRLHIPLIYGLDVIHGYRTVFPVPLALSATWDPTLIESLAHLAATEASANGIRWVFSPMVDISRDARWGRIVESSGEDPYLGSAIARAYVRGYQGISLADPTSVAACVKHFAAYGAVIAGREYNAVDMSPLTLRQFYLPPYRAAIDAGAATIMTSYNSLNGVPSTANHSLLTDVLRNQWKFRGVVISDWGAVPQLQAHGIAFDGKDAARKAILAGNDIDMAGQVYARDLPELVRSGAVPQSVVDDAVRRVLQLKVDLGLFDHPFIDLVHAGEPVTTSSRALAQKAAEESIVLLKNDASVPGKSLLLPIRAKQRIALIGPLADSAKDMLGSWTAEGKEEDVETLRHALVQRAAAEHGSVEYVSGTEIVSHSEAGFESALQAARKADLVVLALGEAGFMTGESSSRTRLDLPGNQEQLLEAVVAAGKPVVLVLFSGRPLAVPWAAEHVPAILEAWFPGIASGPAIADVLFGDTNPSGHLTTTFPRSVGQEPLFYNALNTGRPAMNASGQQAPEDKKVGYSRYIDELDEPLFPFGYGLSYTSFTISAPHLSATRLLARDIAPGGAAVLTADVDITNTGTRSGTDVVQLYLRRTDTSIAEPLRELRGFQRVTVKPGETQHVHFILNFSDFAVTSADTESIEPMHVDIFSGDNSLGSAKTSFDIAP